MKNSDIKKRLKKERTMTSITLRMPEDVIQDLKNIAPTLGFSGYQPLIRAYIGQGLRQDLKKLESSDIKRFVDSLKKHGVKDTIISEAMAELS
ncbi:BrnA antitoxin family protein [bacterium]|nr:BrnA antitoxin family protein [bacterium]